MTYLCNLLQLCVMQLLVKISSTRPKLISWEEWGDICLIYVFPSFCRRAFQQFYQKFIETAFPVEDIYIE